MTHDQALEQIEHYSVDDWGEHPQHLVEDWKYEVFNNDTRRSYEDWVYNRLMNEEEK